MKKQSEKPEWGAEGIRRIKAFKAADGEWYTKQKPKCDACLEEFSEVYQIQDLFLCLECPTGTEAMRYIFKTAPPSELWWRTIKYINPNAEKTDRQKERFKMNLKIRFAVLTRDEFKCVLCGALPKNVKLEVDHIKPVSKGGKTTMDNLRTLCFDCNRGKGNAYGQDQRWLLY